MPKKTDAESAKPSSKSTRWDAVIGRIRPQIFLAILCATIFSMFASWIGYKMGAIEVLTAVIGGAFGFLGGVSLKVLENE